MEEIKLYNKRPGEFCFQWHCQRVQWHPVIDTTPLGNQEPTQNFQSNRDMSFEVTVIILFIYDAEKSFIVIIFLDAS